MALRVAVGIATKGRRDVLLDVLTVLSQQTQLPARVLLAPSDAVGDIPSDIPSNLSSLIHLCIGETGSCAQRNAIIKELDRSLDVILFIDDDFVVNQNFIAETARAFDDAHVLGLSGTVIRDGASAAGYRVAEAVSELRDDLHAIREQVRSFVPIRSTYGCNMAFRVSAILEDAILFDERLSSYGWMEDRDFSARIARFGMLIRPSHCRGIHLSVNIGKVSGTRFGYSQIANPIYLYQKGTLTLWWMFRSICGNFLANLVGALTGSAQIDRIGRLKGNIAAFRDLLSTRICPERAGEIGS